MYLGAFLSCYLYKGCATSKKASHVFIVLDSFFFLNHTFEHVTIGCGDLLLEPDSRERSQRTLGEGVSPYRELQSTRRLPSQHASGSGAHC